MRVDGGRAMTYKSLRTYSWHMEILIISWIFVDFEISCGNTSIKGAGSGVFEFSIIKNEFMCACDEKHEGLPDAFYRIKKYCSWPDLSRLKIWSLHKLALRSPLSQNRKSILSYIFESLAWNLVVMLYIPIGNVCKDKILIKASEREILTSI